MEKSTAYQIKRKLSLIFHAKISFKEHKKSPHPLPTKKSEKNPKVKVKCKLKEHKNISNPLEIVKSKESKNSSNPARKKSISGEKKSR